MSGSQKRFAVDIMLGKLAKWLRTLGFDARSMPIRDEVEVESLTSAGFIAVTRREKLREKPGIIFIGSDHVGDQLKELVTNLNIGREELHLFTRCGVCNSELLRMDRGAAFGSVPDYVFETVSDFRKCPECGKIYWPGSHRTRMLDRIKSATGWDLREEDADGDA